MTGESIKWRFFLFFGNPESANPRLEWILEPPFGESRDDAGDAGDGDTGDTGLLTDTDFYIYQVDWPWCAPLQDEVLAKVRRAVRKLHVISYSAGPRREEQTAYFKYIADHWENLPDFTIFVHPDADEHQGSQFLALRRALKLIKTQSKFAQEASLKSISKACSFCFFKGEGC